jgi:hypothetical protein
LEAKYLPEVINTWAANVGDQIPLMLMTYAGRVAGTVLSKPLSVIGGGTAALATGGPDPTDVATAPAVVAITQEAMKHIGGAVPMVGVEAGAFMDDALVLGIDKDIAEKYARPYGLGSGAIEYAQNLWMLGRYSQISKAGQETIIKQVLSHIGGSVFEGVEEISQGGLENWLLQKAVAEMKTRHPDYDREAPAITEGWQRNGAIGLGVSAFTGAPGTGMTIAKGAATRRQQIKPETKKFLGEPSVDEVEAAEKAAEAPVKAPETPATATTTAEPTITPAEGAVEGIRAAAVRFPDGTVVEGVMHPIIELDLREQGIRIPKALDRGFVTTTGRYVSREEAGVITKKAKQLEEDQPTATFAQDFGTEGIGPEKVQVTTKGTAPPSAKPDAELTFDGNGRRSTAGQ